MRRPSFSISSHRRSTVTRRISLVGQIFVLVALIGASIPLVITAAAQLNALMRYAYPTDGLEATLLSQAHLLWSGQQLYQPFELYRFVSAPYPPWHPLILGFADQFAGLHPFWSGRMVSLISGLLVVVIVALIVRAASGAWLPGFIMAAFFLSTPPLVLWATRIKPDMYALLWTALGLLFATLGIPGREYTIQHSGARSQEPGTAQRQLSRQHVYLVLAAISFALAFFTKQTALAAPLATGLALLAADIHQWRSGEQQSLFGGLTLSRRTLLFSTLYVGLIGVTWLLLDQWSHGQFTFHIWTQHRNALWTPQLLMKFVGLLGTYWPLMVLGIGLLALAWREPQTRVLAFYLLLAPATLYGAGKTGGNHNHLLETLLALTVTGGLVLAWGVRNLHQQPLLASAAIGLVALQLAFAYQPPEWYAGEIYRDTTPERYIIFIRSVQGEVLADDPGLVYLAGKPLRYDDPAGFGPVAHSGLWDQSGLIDDIRNKRFGAIMIPADVTVDTTDPSGRWTPQMLDAVRTSYKLLYRDTIVTYIPK